MIKNIRKIKNLGLFSNYTWDRELDDFRKYNLFYGWNGSGKTTLSKLFSCLEKGNSSEFPNLKYEIDHENGIYTEKTPLNQKVRVFNQDYIQKNVQPANGTANPIFILGEENKEIADQIEADEEILGNLEQKRDAKEAEKGRKEKEKKTHFTNTAKLIGVSTAGSSIRNYRANNVKDELLTLTEKKILSASEVKQKRLVIRQEQQKKIPSIEFEANLDLITLYDEISNICKETVEINIINRLSESKNISEWVEKGLDLHEIRSEKCEFCGSNLPHGRIEALLGHFNAADKQLKKKIEEKIFTLQQTIEAVKSTQPPIEAQFYTDLREKLASQVMSYNQEKENYFAELYSMANILGTKKQKTTEIVTFSRSLDNNFQTELDSFNKLIAQHNRKSDNFQTGKDHAAESLKTHHLSEIYDDIKKLDLEIIECDRDISKFENGDGTDSSVGITKLKDQIMQNKGKISSAHKACDLLNKNLQTFLGRNEIVFEVSHEGGYTIKRNEDVAENLSEGEKTAIAFVYFVVSLEDQDFNLNDGIVVIDDPISSLDSNSLFQAFSFLENAVKDAKQVFILTHNFNFLKLILNWLQHVGKKRRSYMMIKNNYPTMGERTAFISKLDKELEDHESEYHYLFKILYEFNAKTETDESISSVYHIPNIARKILDTFLMFRVPESGSIYDKMEKITFDENKKTAILRFCNDQSHITGDGLDPSLVPETKKNVGYLLEMIQAASPEHYKILKDQFPGISSP